MTELRAACSIASASVAACNTFQPSRSNSAQIAFFTLTSSSMTSTVRIVRVLQFRIVVLERRVKEQQAQRRRWNWTLGTFYQGPSQVRQTPYVLERTLRRIACQLLPRRTALAAIS